MSKPGFWFCRRCKAVVIDGYCDCTESPSPWEWVQDSRPLFNLSPPFSGFAAWLFMCGLLAAAAVIVGWMVK